MFFIAGRKESGGRQFFADAWSAPILGREAALGPWRDAGTFATARRSHASAVANGFLFVLGGNNVDAPFADVQAAKLLEDGTLDSFAAVRSLPTPRDAFTVEVMDGHIIAIGGGEYQQHEDVLSAEVGTDGSLGEFVATAPLPGTLVGHASTGYRRRIYVAGGDPDRAGFLGNVIVSAPAVGGRIASWTATTPLPAPCASLALAATGGHLYATGGRNAGGYLDQVLVAPVGSDGLLGAWTATTPMPFPRAHHASFAHNGWLYVVGGGNVRTRYTEVIAAPIAPDGTLGEWYPVGPLPAGLGLSSLALGNGRVWLSGGAVGSQLQNSVISALIESPPRIGVCSFVRDLGAPSARVVSVTIDGTRTLAGSVLVQYRAAGNDGLFGPLHDLGAAALGAPLPANEPNVRSLYLRLTMDDSDGPATMDARALERDVTSITIEIDRCDGVVCPTADECHAQGTCDPATGQCATNTVKPDGTACDDGSACTRTDSCHSGACTGANPVVCVAKDQCHVAGACDTTTGLCSDPIKPDDTTCDDANACTHADSCESGICTGADPVACAAKDQCHVAGVCDTTTGLCSDPANLDDTSCDDGNACTRADSCQSGVCTGADPVACVSKDQCHVAGSCDTSTGLCSDPAKPDDAACDDRNA